MAKILTIMLRINWSTFALFKH